MEQLHFDLYMHDQNWYNGYAVDNYKITPCQNSEHCSTNTRTTDSIT